MSSSELDPNFPVVSGRVLLGDDWSLELATGFNRRVDDDGLVLWQRDLTLWVNVYGSNGETVERRLQWILDGADPARPLDRIVHEPDMVLVTYERPTGTATLAVEGYALAAIGSWRSCAIAILPRAAPSLTMFSGV
jgi:hypothetical protein